MEKKEGRKNVACPYKFLKRDIKRDIRFGQLQVASRFKVWYFVLLTG